MVGEKILSIFHKVQWSNELSPLVTSFQLFLSWKKKITTQFQFVFFPFHSQRWNSSRTTVKELLFFERDSQEDAVDNWLLFTPLQKLCSENLYFELSIAFCIKWTNLCTKRVPSEKKNAWRSRKPRKSNDFYLKNKHM